MMDRSRVERETQEERETSDLVGQPSESLDGKERAIEAALALAPLYARGGLGGYALRYCTVHTVHILDWRPSTRGKGLGRLGAALGWSMQGALVAVE